MQFKKFICNDLHHLIAQYIASKILELWVRENRRHINVFEWIYFKF